MGTVVSDNFENHRYRLTEWTVPGKDFRAIELYGHVRDADENVNVADQPEHAHIRKELTELLHGGWRRVLPSL